MIIFQLVELANKVNTLMKTICQQMEMFACFLGPDQWS